MLADIIEIDSRTSNPHSLWEKFLCKEKICRKINPLLSVDEPVHNGCVRFVCISDTHEKLEELLPKIPSGDVLVHCGDFTNFGDYNAITKFNDDIGKLPHTFKIVIAGNHDLGFEDNEDESRRERRNVNRGTSKGYLLLTNCHYLQDSFLNVYGLNIYGSSWHPLSGYSFSRNRGEQLLSKWLDIPTYNSENPIDVLLTHTPPLGYNDLYYGTHWGCAELLSCIEKRIRPKFHVYGHVHEQNGLTTNDSTVFVNASICNHQLEITNFPIVFDIPLKK